MSINKPWGNLIAHVGDKVVGFWCCPQLQRESRITPRGTSTNGPPLASFGSSEVYSPTTSAPLVPNQ